MELIKVNLPHSRWKVGKIVDLFVGRDQKIRSAKVFVSPHSYLHRPLSLLYPIECPNEGIDDVGKGNQSTAQSTESTEENKEVVITYLLIAMKRQLKEAQHMVWMI